MGLVLCIGCGYNHRVEEHDHMEQQLWQVWADTGGTFTDCLAVDPGGQLHRAKVLSSAALRARIDRVEATCIFLEGDWNLPDGFFRGAQCRVMKVMEETNAWIPPMVIPAA